MAKGASLGARRITPAVQVLSGSRSSAISNFSVRPEGACEHLWCRFEENFHCCMASYVAPLALVLVFRLQARAQHATLVNLFSVSICGIFVG